MEDVASSAWTGTIIRPQRMVLNTPQACKRLANNESPPVGIGILYRSIIRAHRHNPRNQPQVQHIPDTRFKKRIPPLPTQRYQCQHTRFPRPGFTFWSMDPQLSCLVHEVAYPRQSSCCVAGEVDDGLGIYVYVCMPNADVGEE